MAADKNRVPIKANYKDKDLIGRYVKVLSSSSSHGHKGMFGKIVGFTNTENSYAKVYFDDTKQTVNFSRESLEVVN